MNVVSGSTLTFNNALNLNGHSLAKTGGGMMEINNVLNTGGGAVNLLQGTLSGDGTVGAHVNNDGGTVSPGNSAAVSLAVPEPSAALLLIVSTLALFASRLVGSAVVSQCSHLQSTTLIWSNV